MLDKSFQKLLYKTDNWINEGSGWGISLANQFFFLRGGNRINRFIEGILKEYDYCKNVIKQRFNKNLVMSEEDEKRFKSSNKYCVCNKLFDAGDNKVRDHCHVTEKKVLLIGVVILILN